MAATVAPKPINLALQGGGSHGALTWGVLDRLLDDDRLAIRAISGTSAGAMNAVALGRRHGARRARGRARRAARLLEGGQRLGPLLAHPARTLLPG